MWNLRNKTHEHRGKKREANQETELLTIQNKLRVTGGEVGRGGIG